MKLSASIILVFIFIISGFSQKLGKHTPEEWQTIIDTTWGEGLATNEKLQIFDQYWDEVDKGYAGFHNLDVNWDSLKTIYRPEVEAGISRGRFAAIMNQLVMALMEIHTHCNDVGVRENSLHPGVPLLAFGNVNKPFDNGHFGAGLTPLPDSSALVYQVVDNHPLGLEAGDIILGYDGIPWKYLYQSFLDAEFPITGPVYVSVGTSKKSVSHAWLMSAGLNWHLCDTIDVLKYSSNDTLHLPTSHLIDQQMQIFCTEQLPVPGVPMIDMSEWFEDVPLVTWGIVENTRIGYIYVSRWRWPEKDAFTNAVNNIIDHQTTGLILDFRTNPGGQPWQSAGGFSRLFNMDQDIFGLMERSDPNNHFSMRPVLGKALGFNTDFYLYDKPIAVLTGPLTFSSADYNALHLKYHPMTRIFGKPSNSAFTFYDFTFNNVDIPFPEWQAGYAPRNAYLKSSPGNYLIHNGFDVDEEIWLTREDVAKGEDTVVKRAIEWINNLAYAHDVALNKSYFRPGIDSVLITSQVENPNSREISLTGVIHNSDSTVADSLDLFDDGLHGDNLAGDNIWGNQYPVTSTDEQNYRVSITTDNELDGTSRTLRAVTRFTTIGPVQPAARAYIDTNYNVTSRTQSIFLLIQNYGHVATAKGLSIELSTIDKRVERIVVGSRKYTNLDAGEIDTSDFFDYFAFKYAEGFLPDSTINAPILFDVTVSSSGYPYWTSSFEFVADKGITTDIENTQDLSPLKFSLSQNYPNPFNPKTMINYQLPMTSNVELAIYNLLGQKVATLVDIKQPAGSYKVEWDASGFASGIYLYKLKASGYEKVKKLILLK